MLKKMMIGFIALFAMQVSAETTMSHQNELVTQTIKSFMQENHVSGVAVELYVDGKPSSYYFGEANARTKKPVTMKTIFEIGSIAKLFTSLLLADEVDSAKAQLSNSITQYLPNMPIDYEDVTLLNLATHTSGFAFELPANINSNQKLIAYLQDKQPEALADVNWQYSNIGMELLGIIIEKIEHQDLNTLYRKKILSRLHMQPIGFIVNKQLKPLIAQGYNEQDQPVEADPDMSGGVGMKASAEDMQKFLAAAIGLPDTPERLLYPMRLSQAPYVITHDFMQGLGWEVHTISNDTINDLLAVNEGDILQPREMMDIDEKPVFNKNDLIDKSGLTSGFTSYIAVIPGKQTGIVILANKSMGGTSMAAMARRILFTLNHIEPPTEQKEIAQPSN